MLHTNLKDVTTKQIRLQVFRHSQGEYLYISTDKDFKIKYIKLYSIAEKKEIS